MTGMKGMSAYPGFSSNSSADGPRLCDADLATWMEFSSAPALGCRRSCEAHVSMWELVPRPVCSTPARLTSSELATLPAEVQRGHAQGKTVPRKDLVRPYMLGS